MNVSDSVTDKQRERLSDREKCMSDKRAAKGLNPIRPADAVAVHTDKPPMRGLGDAVRRVATALHIPQCDGCKKRQKDWNTRFPFDSPAIDVTELPKSQESEIQ